MRWPACGSSIRGAEISTPGIGPATEGLSGFELLDASHALSASTAASSPMTDVHWGYLGFIDFHCVSGRKRPTFRATQGDANPRVTMRFRMNANRGRALVCALAVVLVLLRTFVATYYEGFF